MLTCERVYFLSTLNGIDRSLVSNVALPCRPMPSATYVPAEFAPRSEAVFHLNFIVVTERISQGEGVVGY